MLPQAVGGGRRAATAAHSPCPITFVSSARTRVRARLYSPRKNARTSRFCIRARPWSCRNRRKMIRALAPAALFRRSRRLFPQAVRSLERARSGTPPRPNTPAFSGRFARSPAAKTRPKSPKPAPLPFLSSFHHLPKVTFRDNTPLTTNHIWRLYPLQCDILNLRVEKEKKPAHPGRLFCFGEETRHATIDAQPNATSSRSLRQRLFRQPPDPSLSSSPLLSLSLASRPFLTHPSAQPSPITHVSIFESNALMTSTLDPNT